MIYTTTCEPVLSTWDDIDHFSDGNIVELSDDELDKIQGASLILTFAAGVGLGLAIGNRIWR